MDVGQGGGRDDAGSGGEAGGDELLRAFARWAADQRVVEAAAQRALERSLRDQAAASADWTGVLLDLAERRSVVTVTAAGSALRGVLVGVGPDFCVLRLGTGRPALIADAAVAMVEVAPVEVAPVVMGAVADGGRRPAAPPVPAGDRSPRIQLHLASALAALADERSPVQLTLGPGVTLTGQLEAAGTDVLTMRTGVTIARRVHLPIAAVAVCELR